MNGRSQTSHQGPRSPNKGPREAENVSRPGSPAKTPRVKHHGGDPPLAPSTPLISWPVCSKDFFLFYVDAVLDRMPHMLTNHTHTARLDADTVGISSV